MKKQNLRLLQGCLLFIIGLFACISHVSADITGTGIYTDYVDADNLADNTVAGSALVDEYKVYFKTGVFSSVKLDTVVFYLNTLNEYTRAFLYDSGDNLLYSSDIKPAEDYLGKRLEEYNFTNASLDNASYIMVTTVTSTGALLDEYFIMGFISTNIIGDNLTDIIDSVERIYNSSSNDLWMGNQRYTVVAQDAVETFGACETSTDNLLQAECEALVDLYNNTNGSGRTNTGSRSYNLNACSRSGVTCISTGGQDYVTYINLAGNNLSGTLPASLSAFTQLTGFDVSNNNLTGSLPAARSARTNIQYFDASNNNIVGPLPSARSTRTNIISFDIGSGTVIGTLPSSWSARTGITHFAAQNNYLTGAIPDSWTGRGLDYSGAAFVTLTNNCIYVRDYSTGTQNWIDTYVTLGTQRDSICNTTPVVTLNSSSSITITKGSSFTDPGATRADTEDGAGNINNATSGNVNTAVIGTYTIAYTYTDFHGISHTINRIVIVQTAPSSGGGGGSGRFKDSCPKGDYSSSYYDRSCGTAINHSKSSSKQKNVTDKVVTRIQKRWSRYTTAKIQRTLIIIQRLNNKVQNDTSVNSTLKEALDEIVKRLVKIYG